MAKKTVKPENITVQDFSINIRSIDRTPKNLDKWRQALQSAENIIRPSRQLLYDLYAEIVLDDHLISVMDQRRLAVTTSTLTFQHEGEEVDSINALIDSEAFELLLEHILDSRFYGYSLIKADFKLGLVELVPRAHVVPAAGLVVSNPYDTVGLDYTQRPYPNYYLAAGKTNSLGLILPATPLVLIKRGDLSDWAQFNEVFGQPTRVGRYDPNMPGQKEQMQQALKESGAMAYLTIPVGAELDFVEANKTGAADTYDKLFDRMENGLSKLIVGQTMTTTDGSSRSQGEVHERVARKIAQSDRQFVLRLLNGRFRQMLLAQGYGEAAQGEFQFMEEEEQLSKKDRLEMDIKIHGSVGRLKKEYFAAEYNVEFVDDSDEPEQQPDPPVDPKQKEKPDPKGPRSASRKKEKLQADDFFA
jgi:phage gp29-like protein